MILCVILSTIHFIACWALDYLRIVLVRSLHLVFLPGFLKISRFDISVLIIEQMELLVDHLWWYITAINLCYFSQLILLMKNAIIFQFFAMSKTSLFKSDWFFKKALSHAPQTAAGWFFEIVSIFHVFSICFFDFGWVVDFILIFHPRLIYKGGHFVILN